MNKNDKFKYMSTNELKIIKNKADQVYYNNTTDENPMSDEEYDNLISELESRDEEASNIGAMPYRNKITLPFYMGSLNKIKDSDEKKIENWIEKYSEFDEYIIEEKLDGVSALLIYNKGENDKIKLYTRGNGMIGTDISHLIPKIPTIKKIIITDDKNPTIAIRGELIISKKRFKNIYENSFSNARNLVSGLINSIDPILDNNVEFVAYQVMYPQNIGSVISDDALNFISNIGLKTVKFEIVTGISIDFLKSALKRFKILSEYIIDGIVIQPNREFVPIIGENPKNAFAFKMLDEANIKQTRVIKVLWGTSKFGVLKPRLEVEPIEINNVIINFVTAFNAKYITNNKIGPDTIISITRSGDVIPYIVSVDISTYAQMPDVEYVWNDTNVDIVQVGEENNEILEKQVVEFFTAMNILYISQQTVNKMIKNGFNSLFKIMKMTLNDYYLIAGFKENGKMAYKVYMNIQTGLKNRSLGKVLSASSILGYGIGTSRVDLLLETIPDILSEKYNTKLELIKLQKRITEINGFGLKLSEIIISNLNNARIFMKEFYTIFPKEEKEEILPIIEEENDEPKKLQGMIIVFSGGKPKSLVDKILLNGGKIEERVTNNTSLLLVLDMERVTGKNKEAIKKGKRILTYSEFEKEFLEFEKEE